MRGFCHLSRRWHQQFCLSPSFVAHQHCLPSLQPARQYRQPARSRQPPRQPPARKAPTIDFGPVKVNEFEQQGEDATTRVQVHDHFEDETLHAKAELDKLDHELAVMRQGPFGPNSDFVRSFPADEREALLKALEEEGVMPSEDSELITDEELDELARDEEGPKKSTPRTDSLQVTLSIPAKQKLYVKRFNRALDTAQHEPEDKKYFSLWKWYLRCQQHIPNFAMILPEDVWHFLWKSQSTLYYRPKHLQMLGADMIKAEVLFEDKESIEYIDALRTNGDIAAAVETWEAQRPRLGTRDDLAEFFWTTGVRLYVELGRPQKAQRLAFECYDHTTLVDPELLVLVISAWAKSQSESAADHAWFCYLELRERLDRREDDTTIRTVLGNISSILLEVGRTDLALAVFKDMFLLTTKSPKDSLRVFREVAKEASNSALLNEDTINKIGVSSLAVFPRSFHNKYFFTAWIKWLLGEGKVEDAALVVELMYERKIKPDAGPLNGIIAAWLRDGSPGARRKAEQTAWAMIQSRIALVEQRQSKVDPPTGICQSEGPDELKQTPAFLRRGAPAATVETFSILLQYYTRRSDLTNANHLTDVMTASAQIRPNSFIMNHWLYASLRSGQIPDVWIKYSTLKTSIPPDTETFAALWDTAKTHYGSYAANNQRFPDVRTLFAEMQAWFQGLAAKQRAAADADFSAELYEQIIRCFCLSSDPEGTLCALYGLKESFDMLPHEEVTRLIIMQVARSFPSEFDFVARPSHSRGQRRLKNLQYQSAVKGLTEIVVAIMDRMLQEKELDTTAVADVESKAAQELRLEVLTAFLYLVLEKKLKGAGEVSQSVSQVAELMKTNVPMEALVHRDWNEVLV